LKVRVKICGITNAADAKVAVDAGADALGFIFVRKSPRFVEPEKARALISSMPPFVQSVGVFVDQPQEEVREIADYCGLDLLQFHGQESPDYCTSFGSRSIKAFRVKDESVIREMEPYLGRVRGVLLDSWSAKAHGGTGKCFDWTIATRIVKIANFPVILAGGLSAATVTDAIRRVGPYGVDVSSGVELSPGKKDARLVKEFINKVRKAYSDAIL